MKLDSFSAVSLDKALLSKALSSVENRGRCAIYRVGVELEGGWKKVPQGVQLAHDGSVKVEAVDKLGTPVKLALGELPSPVLEVTNLETWMNKYYPSHVNDTCGLHVHMSFRTALTYQRLMVGEFPKTVIAEFQKWALDEKLPNTHPIWPRLRGESEFCQHVFYASEQAIKVGKDYDRHRRGHRYSVINYCYSKGTMECRLLPMMDTPEQGIRAVKHLLSITGAFLVATAKKEPVIAGDFTVAEDAIREVRRETV